MAIAVTTAALVVVLSAMNGLSGIVADLYNAFEPDIRITAANGKFIHAPALPAHNISNSVGIGANGQEILEKVRAVPGVEMVSGSLSEKVLIRNGDRQALVTVKGVDEKFGVITSISSAVTEGRYSINEKGRNEILLGRGVANQLGINLNSLVYEISLFSPVRGKMSSLNPEDNVNMIYCTPCGIFSLNDELDYQYAFVSLATARKLLDLPDQLSAVEVKCAKGETEAVQRKLKQLLGDGYTVKNRYELNDVLFRSLETEKLATFIILAFILVIATFNIIGALTMLIIEKQKDIRTLYSLGADRKLIRNIFMREGLLITGVGAGIGLLLGLFVCWLQIEFHLVTFGSEFVVPYYPIDMQLKDFVWIFVLIMLIGFLAALYPVRVFTRTPSLTH